MSKSKRGLQEKEKKTRGPGVQQEDMGCSIAWEGRLEGGVDVTAGRGEQWLGCDGVLLFRQVNGKSAGEL